MILILADAFDSHADAVAGHLRDRNGHFFRLNLDVPSLRASRIHFDGHDWRVEQGGCSVMSGQVSCVWPRRLTVSLDLDQQTGPEEASFRLWRSEWNRCLYGLYSRLRPAFWMNGIAQASLADNKYHQMEIAKRHGFRIPETISSNDRAELDKFAKKHAVVALKFMSQEIYRLPDNSFAGIYVNKIVADNLNEFSDYGENPITLQRYIEKDYEVRYTYVDGAHLVCKIESQKSERAAVDWRRYDIKNTPHSIIDPPGHIRERVSNFMNEMELSYGALDFIVDKEGEWWYLEVNSAGQWLWIEDLVGLPISATIAGALDRTSPGGPR